MPVHTLTFRDIRRVYALDQEERIAIIAVLQSTPEDLLENRARLDAIRLVRASLPQIPKRDLGNVVPGNPPVEIIDPALGADYSAL